MRARQLLAALHAQKTGADIVLSENCRSLQIFQTDRENLFIRIAIQTVPPQIRRFADDGFQTIIRDFRFPFIAMNAIP